MKAWPFNSVIVLTILLASTATFAEEPEDVTRAYATFYGDGMRHYAEGRNDKAIADFYRAYALKPSPLLLKLIVRTHDFMGHCSAATKQLQFFSDMHPKMSAPRLQICRDPGYLTVSCPEGVSDVIINDQIQARCDQQLALPPGAHEVRALDGGPRQLAVVRSGKSVSASVEAPSPGKTYAKVPLLEEDERYIVIKSPDGLYQLWLRTSLRDDPDMQREGPAGFTVHQGADGLFHISSDALRPVKPETGKDSKETDD